MKLHCPKCKAENSASEDRISIVMIGQFLRKVDQTLHQRYLCKQCKSSFSSATFHPCYRQKKRHLNPQIFQLLASGLSQRRLALLFHINRKTVVRKFLFLGSWSHEYLKLHRHQFPKTRSMEFDDLETFEHSKLKPLSVILAVESKTRRILGFKVARMPAKGLLVSKSLKKYGKRADERAQARVELFRELKDFIADYAVIKSDQNPHYTADVKNHFPNCEHETTKGIRGCVVGQGELKATAFDPIFSLNHTFAMKRANINRLFRRTWNTTKKPQCLDLHIAIYAVFHNYFLLAQKI